MSIEKKASPAIELSAAERISRDHDPVRKRRVDMHGLPFADQLEAHEDIALMKSIESSSSWRLRDLLTRWVIPRSDFDDLKRRVDGIDREKFSDHPSPDTSRLRLLNNRELRLFGLPEGSIAYIRTKKNGVMDGDRPVIFVERVPPGYA